MRTPLDPNETYTVLSASAARRTLQRESSLARHQTAGMTLDQLHDALAERLAPEKAALAVVVTDRAFARITSELDALVRRMAGRPVWPGAAIMSRTGAVQRLERAGVSVPDDAPDIELEDAIAGLEGDRPTIISDDDMAAYGAEAHRLLSAVPSGRTLGDGTEPS